MGGLHTSSLVICSPIVEEASPAIKNPTGTSRSGRASHPSARPVGSLNTAASAQGGVANITLPSLFPSQSPSFGVFDLFDPWEVEFGFGDEEEDEEGEGSETKWCVSQVLNTSSCHSEKNGDDLTLKASGIDPQEALLRRVTTGLKNFFGHSGSFSISSLDKIGGT